MLSIVTSETKSYCDYGQGSSLLKANVKYIMNMNWAKELGLSPIPHHVDNYNINTDLSNKRLLFIRAIGGGDLLFLSPIIQLLKKKYPTCKIGFACILEQHGILKLIPGIDEIIQYPIVKDVFDNYDYYFQVAQVVEGNVTNQERNIYEVYAETLGILDISSEYCRPQIKNIYSNDIKDDKLIGIHPFANDPIRTLDSNIIKRLCIKLSELKYRPIIIGTKEDKDKWRNLSEFTWSHDEYPSYQDVCHLINKCKTVIVTDSLIMHLAQAIGTQTISIHGPFAPDCRVKYYQNITIVDSNPECRCFLHQYGKCKRGFRDPLCLRFDIQNICNIITNDPIDIIPTVMAPQIEIYGI